MYNYSINADQGLPERQQIDLRLARWAWHALVRDFVVLLIIARDYH